MTNGLNIDVAPDRAFPDPPPLAIHDSHTIAQVEADRLRNPTSEPPPEWRQDFPVASQDPLFEGHNPIKTEFGIRGK